VDSSPLLSPASARALRLIVREAASNTIWHARASRFRIDAAVSGDRLYIDIGDDGPGGRAGRPGQDHGLSDVAARVQGLGGVVDRHREAAGARLTASFPLREAPP